MRTAYSKICCLLLPFLLLSACTSGEDTLTEPAPIEVPPPVEQTNEGLTVLT